MVYRHFLAVAFVGVLVVGALGCSTARPSIAGKWSGWMTVECPHPLPSSYHPLTIALELTADGQCTNVHGSGIGADITTHCAYKLVDGLLFYINHWGTDTLQVVKLTATELVLRRAEKETGCTNSFVMTREEQPTTPP